jgi:hypothetical protein
VFDFSAISVHVKMNWCSPTSIGWIRGVVDGLEERRGWKDRVYEGFL